MVAVAMESPLSTADTSLDARLIRLHPGDNIAVVTEPIAPGAKVRLPAGEVAVAVALSFGWKIAVEAIERGATVFKYGCSIGSATVDIRPGDHVHLHNLRSHYLPTVTLQGAQSHPERAT